LFEQDEKITFENYLNKMGIDDIKKYLKAPNNVLDNCYVYDNMRECVNTIKYHILNNSKIAIIVDSDTDGYCSSYMMYKYLKLHGVKKVKPFIQNGKERGIESEQMRKRLLEWKPNLLIIPDAGTNSAEWEDEIIDNEIDICIIDHHDSTNKVCKRAIVVNNTMNKLNCNRNLSGTGVTFKVLQALDLDMNTKYSDRFIDLVGLSIISDSMNVTTYENRWFLKHMFTNESDNIFMYELFDTLLPSSDYTQRDVSFRIIPLFNSVIRCGTIEDKQNLFLAFDGKHIEDTIKMCQKYHSLQVKIVNEFIEAHQNQIEIQEESNIIIIDNSDAPKAFNGLIAGKISGITNKPCIVGKVIGTELKGSFRGYIKISVMNTLPHVIEAAGHAVGAYGISIDVSNPSYLDEFRAEVDNMDISITPTVITSYKANKVPTDIFKEFVGYKDIWGKELDKPRFYIYNVKVKCKDIKLMGKKEDTIKISLDDYEIIFFKLTPSQIEQFEIGSKKEININLIGNVDINEWRGKKTNQILVEDFEIEEVKDDFEDLM
jgi:single-stranded-DNA-specific exonuclease